MKTATYHEQLVAAKFHAVYRSVDNQGYRDRSHVRRRGVPAIVLTAPTLGAAKRELRRKLRPADKPENWVVMPNRGPAPPREGARPSAELKFPPAAPKYTAPPPEPAKDEGAANVTLAGHILTDVLDQVREHGADGFDAKYGSVRRYVVKEWGQNARTADMVVHMMGANAPRGRGDGPTARTVGRGHHFKE